MKVIQVGLGGMGNAWLRAVQQTPEVEYAGFVEINPKIAAPKLRGDSSAKTQGIDVDADPQ